MEFVSTERIYWFKVEGTTYMFESDEGHDIFPPRNTTPELQSAYMTYMNDRILQKVGRISSHLTSINWYLQNDSKASYYLTNSNVGTFVSKLLFGVSCCHVSLWLLIALTRKSLKTDSLRTFKYVLKDIVEYIYHHMFEAMWNIIIISLWFTLNLLIIYHFLPGFPFLILTHEVTLVFIPIKSRHLFINHNKIWIFHIAFWILITINITVYDIWNL